MISLSFLNLGEDIFWLLVPGACCKLLLKTKQKTVCQQAGSYSSGCIPKHRTGRKKTEEARDKKKKNMILNGFNFATSSTWRKKKTFSPSLFLFLRDKRCIYNRVDAQSCSDQRIRSTGRAVGSARRNSTAAATREEEKTITQLSELSAVSAALESSANNTAGVH